MKNAILSILAVALLSLQSMSQVNAEKETMENKKVKKEGKQEETVESRSKSGSRYKDRYLHLGYFSPELTPVETYLSGPFTPNAKPKYGFFIEKGKYRFYRDEFMLKNKCNIGLYSGFSFGFVLYNFDLPESFSGYKIPFSFLDYKLGPDFRFKISDEVKLDLYGNIGILIAVGGLVLDEGFDPLYNPTIPIIAMQTGVGLDVSFGPFIVGAQYNFVQKDKYKYKYNVEKEFNNENGPYTETVSEQYDVLLNSFKVHFGFIFSK